MTTPDASEDDDVDEATYLGLVAPPSLLPILASVSLDILSAATQRAAVTVPPTDQDGATSNELVVFESAPALTKLIDDAVNRADASRGRSRKGRANTPSDCTAAGPISSADDGPDEVKSRESWQQRAKKTDWHNNNNKSIVNNFPPVTKTSQRGMKISCLRSTCLPCTMCSGQGSRSQPMID